MIPEISLDSYNGSWKWIEWSFSLTDNYALKGDSFILMYFIPLVSSYLNWQLRFLYEWRLTTFTSGKIKKSLILPQANESLSRPIPQRGCIVLHCVSVWLTRTPWISLSVVVMFYRASTNTEEQNWIIAPRENTGQGSCRPLVKPFHQPIST